MHPGEADLEVTSGYRRMMEIWRNWRKNEITVFILMILSFLKKLSTFVAYCCGISSML